MRVLCATALALSFASPMAALAYTQEDAVACTGDVMRLCQTALPDEGRVVSCMVKNKHRLTAACTLVFNRLSSTRQTARAEKIEY